MRRCFRFQVPGLLALKGLLVPLVLWARKDLQVHKDQPGMRAQRARWGLPVRRGRRVMPEPQEPWVQPAQRDLLVQRARLGLQERRGLRAILAPRGR